jgi:hypothetical protein
MEGVTIPRQLKITSKYEDNSIDHVRDRLRTNLIDHKKYDPTLSGMSGNRYFKTVYQMNNPAHVVGNKLSEN